MKWYQEQLAHPEGVLGWLIGFLMALTWRRRSRWALSVLSPAPGERILEVGFGPGSDLRRLAKAVGPRGFVGGVDISATMVRIAAWRNRRFIREGRVMLQHAGATELPYEDASFHAVYTMSSAQYWPDLPRALAEIARVLRPGGRVVLVALPRKAAGKEEDGDRWKERLVRGLLEVGLTDVQGDLAPTRPPGGYATGRLPRRP